MSKSLEEVTWDFDERRNIAIPGNAEETLIFSVDRWLAIANKAIAQRGLFNCALSGGSTPKKLYQALKDHKNSLDWTKARLYFSDERCVSTESDESNFKMAWDAGLSALIDRSQIFPMYEKGDPEKAAKVYENLLEGVEFDLIMLGMGDDGHTASLFPETHALKTKGQKVTANFLPKMDVWRITMTFEEINRGRHINLYVMGASKASMIKKIFTDPYDPNHLPSQKVGTSTHKALWILDKEAASLLE